jgi:hypothetical protein
VDARLDAPATNQPAAAKTLVTTACSRL